MDGSAGTASAIAAGERHSCAIHAGTGAVVCWGAAYVYLYGELVYIGQATPPPSVDGTAGTASAIAAGGSHTLAIREVPACADGIDNDGDGLVDYGEDLGCDSAADDSEKRSPTPGRWQLVCDDGVDNDSDGLVDYPSDPGCFSPAGSSENPACADGLDNDGDGAIDHFADPQYTWPWKNSESRAGVVCGIGFELALVLPPLLWLHRRRRNSRFTNG